MKSGIPAALDPTPSLHTFTRLTFMDEPAAGSVAMSKWTDKHKQDDLMILEQISAPFTRATPDLPKHRPQG